MAAIVVTRRRAGRAAAACRAGAEVDAMPTRIAPPRAAVGRAASEGASMFVERGETKERKTSPARARRDEC